MKSPWTTTTGIIGIITALICAYHKFQMHDYGGILECFTGIATGVGLVAAKDFNVTGGTKPVTVEALSRTTPAAAEPVA